jgi:hypothetical protein
VVARDGAEWTDDDREGEIGTVRRRTKDEEEEGSRPGGFSSRDAPRHHNADGPPPPTQGTPLSATTLQIGTVRRRTKDEEEEGSEPTEGADQDGQEVEESLLRPFGAIARYHISRLLNPISSTLPYGTLFCNTLSTTIVEEEEGSEPTEGADQDGQEVEESLLRAGCLAWVEGS